MEPIATDVTGEPEPPMPVVTEDDFREIIAEKAEFYSTS
jgi:hypothetical protein